MGKKLLLLFFLLLFSNKTVNAQEWILQAPSSFPKFFSSNTNNDKLLNDFFYRHFSAMVGPSSITGDQQTEWSEWNALTTTWIDTNSNQIMSNSCNVMNSSCGSGAPCGACRAVDYNYWLKKILLEVKMEDNGQVWTYWNWQKDWPCAPDCGVWHPTNNTAFIISSGRYFKWTNDVEFLKNQIARIRRALRFLQIEMHGDEKNLMENTMAGYDGLTTPGHGKTSNYWDILPFGFRDANLTLYYYKALNEMADLEEYVEKNPNIGVSSNSYGETSGSYRRKAEAVKNYASVYFWNDPSWSGGSSTKNFSKGRLSATVDLEGGFMTMDLYFSILKLFITDY